MKRRIIAGAAVAAMLALAGPAQAQTRAVPGVNGPLIGSVPTPDTHATLSYWNGSAIVTYDLGGKMVNCYASGAPSAGSTADLSRGHPCR